MMRHATVVTVISIVLFLLFWCSLRYDWQRDFHQFCAWSWRFLSIGCGSDSFFNHRCDYRFFGYALLVTHFLIELTLFTTRLNRTYTFFLFGFLKILLFNIQRLRFLLRLTFIIITAAATFTTRRLLLVGGTRFFRYLSLLTALTRLGSLLLCLATITTVFFAIIAAFSTFTTGVAALITVTAVVLTRLATILLRCSGFASAFGVGCSDGLVSSPPLNSAFSAEEAGSTAQVGQERLVLPVQI